MARVYPNCYTQSAMHNMGYYFMYGVEGCHLDPDKLASMLVTSGLARSPRPDAGRHMGAGADVPYHGDVLSPA